MRNLKNKMYLALLLCSLAFTCTTRGHADPYTVPEPLIQLLSPKGLRVSIPHEEGITLFAFHGSVNTPLLGLEAGQISADVVHKKGSRWVYENKKVKVHPGDEIYFWLYVLRNNLGYRLDDGYHKVSDDTQGYLSSGLSFSQEKTRAVNSSISCENACVNVTHRFMSLFNKIESLQEDVDILLEAIEKLPNSKILTLNGSIPKEEDATLTVRSVTEKLDVQVTVDLAERNPDGSITFTVTSPSEKLKLLKAAREKLEGTRITLS